MIERIVSSLAILKVNSDHGQNYLDSFVPFIAACVALRPAEPVSLPQLQADVAHEFGLQIPQSVLRSMLRRAHRSKYLLYKHGVYRCDDAALPFPQLISERNKALRQSEALIQRLCDFCQRHYQVTWSHEEAYAALFAFLDQHSLSILRASVAGRPLVPTQAPPDHTDFLVGAFIAQTEQQDPDGFGFLETITRGRMLADMLLLPGATAGRAMLRALSVYLDTTLVLRVIGVAHPHLRTPCQELVTLLREQGASLKLFEHTLGEIQAILYKAQSCLANLQQSNGATGETIEYLIQAKAKPSDVEILLAKLPELLAEHQITMVPTPPYERQLGVDEEKLQQLLQEELGYRYPGSLQRDIKSLTAIHRLRGGQARIRLEDCRAIFVTTNTRLAQTSARFFADEHEAGVMAIPHAVADQVMATLAWLKLPTGAPNLPRHLLVANCFAALRPSEALWQKYLAEIDRLLGQGAISERDYYLLRYAASAREALMESTLGEPEVFTEGTVEEVLARAQAEIRRTAEAQAEAAEAQRQAAEQALAQITTRVSAASVAHQQRIASLSARWGKIVSRACLVLFVIVLIVLSLVSAPWPFIEEPTETWRWIACGAAVAMMVVSLVSLWKGTTVAAVVEGIERRATRMFVAVLTSFSRWLNLQLPQVHPSPDDAGAPGPMTPGD